MYCRNCGTKQDDNASFCNHCGAPLNQPATQEKDTPDKAPKVEPKKKLSKKTWIIIIVSVVVVALLGIMVGVIVHHNKNNDTIDDQEIQYIFGKDDQYLKNIKISLRCTNRGSFEKLESKLLMKMEEQFGPSDGLISGKGNTRGYKGYRWQKDGTRLSMLMSSNQQTEFDFFGQEHKYYEIILVIRPQN